MKKIIFLLSLSLFITACSTEKNITKEQNSTTTTSLIFDELKKEVEYCFDKDSQNTNEEDCKQKYEKFKELTTTIRQTAYEENWEGCLVIASETTCLEEFEKAKKSKEHDRQTALFNESLANNDLKLCLSLSYFERICKREFGIKNNDVALCLEIPENTDGDFRGSDKYTCLSTVAIKTTNDAVCDKIDQHVSDKWGIAGDSCRQSVLTQKQKQSAEGLTDEQITTRAITENNFDLCYAIEHIEHNRDCQLAIAKLNNMYYCEKIDAFNGEQHRFDCYEFYGKTISTGYLYNYDDEDKDNVYDYLENKIWQTDPKKADTDNDGYLDGEEIKNGHNPLGQG